MTKIRKNKKIGENFAQGVMALMVSQVFIKVLGLVYKWYLTNKEGFGDEGNAIYGAGFSIYALLLTFSSTGVPNAVSKLVSKSIAKGDYKGTHRILKISLATFTVIGLIGTLILFFGAYYISNYWLEIPEAENALVSLSPSIFFVSIISVFRGYFNGKNNIKTTATSQIVEQLFKTVFTIIFVELIAMSIGLNTTLMAAGANFATTMATITSFIYVYLYYKSERKELSKQIINSPKYPTKSLIKTVKNILYVSIPMSLSSILASINRNIDAATVVKGLKNFIQSDIEAKSQYGILSGKVDTLVSLPLSFNIAFATALVPAITSAKTIGDNKTIEKKISYSLLITILIGLPCMIGMILFSEQILNLLFPNAPEGKIIFTVSSISIIFTVLEQTVNGALQGIGKIMTPAIALLIGVIFKLILNIILIPIPYIGTVGAAFGTVVCHAIAFLIGFNVLRKNIKLNLKISKFIFKPLIAVLIMSICSYSIYIITKSIIIEKIATIISILIGGIIYIFSIFLLEIFTQEEIFRLPYGKKIYKILKKIKIY